jgi:alkyldihydroxyacetonephosphate synthase
VYPESHEETLAVLTACAKYKTAVVPFGGGSSVVGGVEGLAGPKHKAVVTVDTTRMAQLLEIDEVSHTARFQCGIWGPDLEDRLQSEGWTLGHYPQSFEFSTLGGWIAARGAGQQSNRYGAANKWLVAARLATPTGEWRTLPFPQSAAGPDMNELIAGSEGVLGVITEATVKIHRLPETRDYRAYLFKSFEAGAAVVREIVQAGVGVAMMRLSDAEETHFFGTFKNLIKPPSRVEKNAEKVLDKAGYGAGRCVLMIGLEGAKSDVRHALARTLWIATRGGGLPVGQGPGHAWYEQRFAMPYLRDPMLDRGIGIDTLETSTEWGNLPRLYDGVRAAIRAELGPNSGVLTHISHSYADGASLYFTYIFARDLDDELAQWVRVKRAASEAISRLGGTISHHHGVGKDHAEWFATEKGALAVDLLSDAKKTVDPTGILNPRKMLSDEILG